MCSSATYSTCATNPFFSSSTSSGGCDFQRNVSPFSMASKFRTCTDDMADTSEPMTIMEEAAEDMDTFNNRFFSETAVDITSVVKEPTMICYPSKDLTVTRSTSRSPSIGPIGSVVSAENPLFRSALRGSLKQRRSSSRCSSVSDKGEEKLVCPLTAPPLTAASFETPQPARIRSVRSESQLSAILPSTQHLTTMREKLASARSMIASSFSQRMRHLLTKRASWPHAVPYMAGLTSSESETSALWALAPPGTKDTPPPPVISIYDGLDKFTSDQTSPSKSRSESTVFYDFYGQRMSAVVEDSSSISSTSGARLHSVTESSLLAPPFDIDSPESGFVESPTALHHQRETTPSSTASGHVAATTAPSMFLHRDPERDSLGSTSSLEIAVS
jgi:hypothetical protein